MTDMPQVEQPSFTVEEIARHYDGLGASVDRINEIIAGDHDEFMNAEEREDCINRNVEHLQLMVAKDFWTTEDMTAVNAAIAANS